LPSERRRGIAEIVEIGLKAEEFVEAIAYEILRGALVLVEVRDRVGDVVEVVDRRR
jgi:hypothetical protein